MIKTIKFDLPINGVKVKNLDELQDNLTDEIVALAKSGLLFRWFRSRNLMDEATLIQAALDSTLTDAQLFETLCSVIGVEVSPEEIAALFSPQCESGKKIDSSLTSDALEEAIFNIIYRTLVTRIVYSLNGGTYVCSGKVANSRLNNGSYDCNVISDTIFDTDELIAKCSNGNTVNANPYQRMKIAGINQNLTVEAGEIVFALEEDEDDWWSNTFESRLVLFRCISRAFLLEIDNCDDDTARTVLENFRNSIEKLIDEIQEKC